MAGAFPFLQQTQLSRTALHHAPLSAARWRSVQFRDLDTAPLTLILLAEARSDRVYADLFMEMKSGIESPGRSIGFRID